MFWTFPKKLDPFDENWGTDSMGQILDIIQPKHSKIATWSELLLFSWHTLLNSAWGTTDLTTLFFCFERLMLLRIFCFIWVMRVNCLRWSRSMAGKEADAKRHQTTKPHLPASKWLCLANPMLKPQCGMTVSKRQICWGNHCDKVGITISNVEVCHCEG